MKNKIIIILILFAGLAFGQTVMTFTMGGTNPDKPADMEILLGCGFAGTSSAQLNAAHFLINSKDYAGVLKNLRSTDLLTQLLSVIAAEELNKRNQLELSPADLEIISKVKSSGKTYYCCNGCTGHYHGNIAGIFKPKLSNYNNILMMLRLQIGLDTYEEPKK